ncbi:hypothetical protein FK513_32600, partial [Klebsiella pneumoniae]|nr:hypothetical protein [Klebsiella pneumoniae]
GISDRYLPRAESTERPRRCRRFCRRRGHSGRAKRERAGGWPGAPATANLARGEAAKRIVDLAPAGFSKVFFTNAGADAISVIFSLTPCLRAS